MLVAEKKQYIEAYYPPAVGIDQPISIPKPKEVVKPKTATSIWLRISHISLVLIGFAICSYTVARFAIIAQKQQEIMELGKSLEKQIGIQEELKLELIRCSSLYDIEEYAKSNLEMDYPTHVQVHYVDLPDWKDKTGAKPFVEEVNEKENLWSLIVSLLD